MDHLRESHRTYEIEERVEWEYQKLLRRLRDRRLQWRNDLVGEQMVMKNQQCSQMLEVPLLLLLRGPDENQRWLLFLSARGKDQLGGGCHRRWPRRRLRDAGVYGLSQMDLT